MSTTAEEPLQNESSPPTPAPPLKTSPPPAAEPSIEPAPPSLCFSFQIKLKEGENTCFSTDKTFDLSISGDPAAIVQLGEQVKTLFKIMGFDPLLIFINSLVNLKLKAASEAREKSESNKVASATSKEPRLPAAPIHAAEPQTEPVE